jgi:hypothetical protein
MNSYEYYTKGTSLVLGVESNRSLSDELRTKCVRNALDSVCEQRYSVKKNGGNYGRVI